MRDAAVTGAGIGIGDLTRIRWLDQPRPNASGTHLAYTERWLDGSQDGPGTTVVVADRDGRTLLRVELAGRPDAGLAWSPDGRRLAVAADELLVVDVGGAPGGRPCVIVTVANLAATQVDWEPDGDRVVVERDAGSASGVCRLHPGATGSPELVVPGGRHPVWTATGRIVALRAADDPVPRDELVAADADGDAVRVLSPPGRHVLAAIATHKRHRVAYLDRQADRLDATPELHWIDLGTGSRRSAPTLPNGTLGLTVQADDSRGVSPQLSWSAASRRVYAYETVGGCGHLRWFDEEGRTGTVLAGDGAALSPGCSDTGTLLAVRAGPTHPGDVWRLVEGTGALDRVTDSNAWADGVAVAPESLELAGPDGRVDGWLWRPPTGSARSLVVSVHGGPYYAVGTRFTFETQRLVALGYAVLTFNPRGSAGRDAAFSAAIAGDWGGPDAQDVEAAVDGLSGRFDDAVVTGVSYGGFLAQLLLTRSSRFVGAISENGISDFTALHAGTARQRLTAEWAMGGPPDSTDHYRTRSPRPQARAIAAPLLLVHAEDDRTCPVDQSRDMEHAMTAAGRDVELVTLPGEGHLINLDGRPSSRRRRAAAVDGWLARVTGRRARSTPQGGPDGRDA